jgi:hypothetical protein
MNTNESGAVGLLAVSAKLTDVGSRECLGCYLERMLTGHGCFGLNFTIRWRDAQPAPMPALLPWLAAGGGYCDCEVVMNVLSNATRSTLSQALQCEESYQCWQREIAG